MDGKGHDPGCPLWNSGGNPTLHVMKTARARKLDEIYRRIPRLDCQRKCQIACGKVRGERQESELLLVQIGKNFGTVRMMEWSADGVHYKASPFCEFLNEEGQCGVYSLRPLMCRLFGVAENLKCPHGCQPERWLNHFEVQELIRAVNAL